MVNGRLTRLTMKPGVSAARTGVLPHAVHQRGRAVGDLRVRRRRGDDLDERHQRRGIEEVQAEDALGPGRSGRDRGHGQRARVGRHDGVGREHRVERRHDPALDREVLDRRLDDEVGAARGRRGSSSARRRDARPVDPVVDGVGSRSRRAARRRQPAPDRRDAALGRGRDRRRRGRRHARLRGRPARCRLPSGRHRRCPPSRPRRHPLRPA